jgi:hypothetical protein
MVVEKISNLLSKPYIENNQGEWQCINCHSFLLVFHDLLQSRNSGARQSLNTLQAPLQAKTGYRIAKNTLYFLVDYCSC